MSRQLENGIVNLFLKKTPQLQALVITLFVVIVITLIYIWWHHPFYGKNKRLKVYPVIGNIIQLLWHQNHVLDFMTYHIKNQPTAMIESIFLSGLCVYITTNPMNVEYILKTNFW
jgi:ABC-type thiamin/hydroxymethylpyrimidine transport system permease subunit